MKRGIISVLMAVIFICSMGGIQPSVQTKATSCMDLDAIVQSDASVKLKWKGKNVTSYVIYRGVSDGKLKKIATVSSKKTSYVDKTVKKNKTYDYEIYGYRNKKRVYDGNCYAYTGVPKTHWAECQEVEAENTPQSLTLHWEVVNGIKPTGFEIYRADNFSDFKKLKTLNAHKYIDKTVKAKHTYYYKIRAYYTKAGKKEYGAFSEITKHRAVYADGKYELKVVEEQNVSPSAITVAVTSAAYNGDLTFDFYDEWSVDCTSIDKTKNVSDGVGKIDAYSMDGENWKKSVGEKIRIKEGETVYLRFCILDKDGKPVDLGRMTIVKMYNDDSIRYDGFWSIIEFDAKNDTSFTTDLNGELYY